MAVGLTYAVLLLFAASAFAVPVKDSTSGESEGGLHHFMTEDEIRRSFGVDHHSKVPVYDTFSIQDSSSSKGSTGVAGNMMFSALNRDFEISLDANSALAGHDHTIEYHHADGTVTRSVASDAKHSIGRLTNDPDSLVALSHDNGLSGVITTKEDMFVVKPIPPRLISKRAGHDHFMFPVYSKKDTKADEKSCGFDASNEINLRKRSTDVNTKRQTASTTKKAKTIELLVAGDKTMVDFHGKDFVATYLLVIMNIAAGLFQSPTLSYPLTLAVVRVVVFEDETFSNPESMSTLLHSFHTWAEEEQKKTSGGDSNPEYFDNAVLMTRNDCLDGCSVAGLAYFGVCDETAQNVVKDKGLQTGVTVAHELAHNLKTIHDGVEAKECTNNINLMATSVPFGPHSLEWSNCTSKSLAAVLSDDTLTKCYDDQPTKIMNDLNFQLYGQVYSADQQCQMAFGPSYQYCSQFVGQCDQLACHLASSSSCVVSPYAMAHGTPCGTRKWCIQAECVPDGTDEPSSVNGAWGEWSDHGKCNRDCGVGVQYRSRECNNPAPSGSGKSCVGSSKKDFKTCSVQDCSAGTPSFRQQQCTAKAAGTEPLVVADKPCNLFCGNFGSGLYYHYVEPGTRCPDTNSNSICVENECKPMGCDLSLQSGSVKDRCGVCNGDGSSCSVVSGRSDDTYSAPQITSLVAIPAGATNIEIKELSGSLNFLGVKIAGTSDFVLSIPRFSATAQIGSATMYYDMEDYVYPDKITIKGTLEKGIEVFVVNYYGGVCNGIAWKYSSTAPSSSSPTAWKTGEWGACSQSCAGGVQTRAVTCNRQDDSSAVSAKYCDAVVKPTDTQTCSEANCPAKYHVSDYSSCSKTCGKGVKTRTILCSVEGPKDVFTPISDASQCTDTKPSNATEASCNEINCPARYEAGSWSACSTSCTQSREVGCRRTNAAGSDVVANILECSKLTKPAESQPCSQGCNSG